MTPVNSARVLAVAALAIGVVALAVVTLTGGSSYTLNARFLEAGGLVSGGKVEVGGIQVGSISSVTVTPNGQANVTLSISDRAVTPLHAGTRAVIRAVGQAGITNNFVVLTPGVASAPTLRSGAELPTTQTQGIVPIDALLDSFGPAQRASLDQLLSDSDQVYAGSGAPYFNQMLGELDPALGELDGFTSDLALDRGALGELVNSTSAAASAIAARRSDLSGAVVHTAQALGSIASQRTDLSDLLARMPAVLGQARGTLDRAGVALTTLRPALRAAVPVAAPLHDYLERLNMLLPEAAPVVADLRAQLPGLDRSLSGLRPIERPAISALNTLGPAMKGLDPIFTGLRYYGTDLVLGVLSGLVGIATGEYDGYSHYAKANFVQSAQTVLAGPLSAILAAHPLVPGVLDTRTGLSRRCPGGNQPPAPDGSSPWDVGAAYCTASEDEPLSVDFP